MSATPRELQTHVVESGRANTPVCTAFLLLFTCVYVSTPLGPAGTSGRGWLIFLQLLQLIAKVCWSN